VYLYTIKAQQWCGAQKDNNMNQHKFTHIDEIFFKQIAHRHKSDSEPEKRVYAALRGAMNVFHRVEHDYDIAAEGWRSYPFLRDEDLGTAITLIEGIGGKYAGRWK